MFVARHGTALRKHFRVDFWRNVNVGTSITNDIKNEITYSWSPQKTKWKKKSKRQARKKKLASAERTFVYISTSAFEYRLITAYSLPLSSQSQLRPTSRFIILGLKPKIPDQRKQFILDFSEFMFKNKPGPSPDNKCKPSIAPCKRKHQCWPTTSNIVGCYMLRPFAHPVACCCVLSTGMIILILILSSGVKMEVYMPHFLSNNFSGFDRWHTPTPNLSVCGSSCLW